MMVDIMQPTKEDKQCDPAYGTAGFLVAAGEYIHDNDHATDWFHEQAFKFLIFVECVRNKFYQAKDFVRIVR